MQIICSALARMRFDGQYVCYKRSDDLVLPFRHTLQVRPSGRVELMRMGFRFDRDRLDDLHVLTTHDATVEDAEAWFKAKQQRQEAVGGAKQALGAILKSNELKTATLAPRGFARIEEGWRHVHLVEVVDATLQGTAYQRLAELSRDPQENTIRLVLPEEIHRGYTQAGEKMHPLAEAMLHFQAA